MTLIECHCGSLLTALVVFMVSLPLLRMQHLDDLNLDELNRYKCRPQSSNDESTIVLSSHPAPPWQSDWGDVRIVCWPKYLTVPTVSQGRICNYLYYQRHTVQLGADLTLPERRGLD
jgi:hypothetical protein